MAPASAPHGPREEMLGRTLRFMAGMIVGLLALPVLAGLAFAILAAFVLSMEAVRPDRSAEVRAAFWTDGGDVSRDGGATLLVRTDTAVIRQTCRETCDDLTDWSGVAKRVEVRTADGACRLCRSRGLRFPFTSPKRSGVEGSPIELYERPWR